ncbi:glycosyltransferase [Micrococcus sp.]|uniref:glycosyltransferase n=1 Tax=Micrococcus sp. TaxID=1271 RepID=UPI0026DBDC99|nr:glycosyltransferase [Micrococcus sp.]MDO4240424.1 glycosyltransferase [Micrococcus sp.]
MYLGKIAEVRGVHTVVRALADLPGVHAAFVVSADEGPRAALRAEARTLGVEERVHLLDYVPSASVTWYVESATLGLSPLLPTPAHESAMATKLREYIQAGLPLVVSDLREQARFVREQQVGVVHAPGDPADLARAVREALARLDTLRESVARPEVQDAHRWEAAERVLHRVWTSLVPVPAPPLEAPIAPSPVDPASLAGLTVVGDAPAGHALAEAWRAAGAPAVERPAVSPPEDPRLLAGGPGPLGRVLADWIHDDETAAAVLYAGQGPAGGRAEGSVALEAASLLARGRGVGLLAGDTLLADPRLRRRAVPGHPWNELDEETFAALERRARRARRPYRDAMPSGAVVLTHSHVEAALDPDLVWLPRPIPAAPAPTPGTPRSVLVLPGDRTDAERTAVTAMVAELQARGVPVEAPSGPRFRRRGPHVWNADVVVDLLHTGEPSPAAEHAGARGAAVVAGPVLFDGPGTPSQPVTVTDESGLTSAVLRLLEMDEEAWAARAAAALAHRAAVHAPEEVGRRLRAVLTAPGRG